MDLSDAIETLTEMSGLYAGERRFIGARFETEPSSVNWAEIMLCGS